MSVNIGQKASRAEFGAGQSFQPDFRVGDGWIQTGSLAGVLLRRAGWKFSTGEAGAQDLLRAF